MSKNLVIVESPSKARTISRILGSDYHVMASMGHIRDLPEKGLGVDVDHDFKPVYRRTPSRKKVIGELIKAAKSAEKIYLATDPDREGEAISWHIAEILKKENKTAEFARVSFHEITRPAVQASFDDPTTVDMDLVNAQQARRVLDRLVGYQVSPLLWKRVEKGTSAGRVQSVALRLICEREELVKNFVPKEYWVLTGAFDKIATKEPFKAKLVRINDQNVRVPKGGLSGAKAQEEADAEPKGNVIDIASAEAANEYAADAEGGNYAVSSVKKTPRRRNPRPPFITSTLQQAASANLGYSPDQTMRLAQQLYEGVEGAGESGLITYMRTDSVNISTVAQDAAKGFIEDRFGPKFIPAKPNRYKSKASAQEAHEAIRPTDVTLTPEKAKASLDSRQARLYALVWNRFVASQMAPAQMMQYTVEISSAPGSATHKYDFRATSTSVTFPGFMKVYDLDDVSEDKEGEEAENKLPELTEQDACDLKALDRDQKFTEPPARFSEAMLIREMENNGVGRPSTYASIVNTIKNRNYVDKQKGKLFPTDLGNSVDVYLVEHLPKLFQVGFTAKMEEDLDNIEKGQVEWVAMLQAFYTDFSAWMQEAGADTGAPDNSVVKAFLGAFDAPIQWAEPQKAGRRTYDDKKFCASLQKQVDEDKKLSARQWNALLTLAGRYEDQIPAVAGLVQEHGFDKAYAEIKERLATRAKQEPDEAALALCSLLEQVSEWDKPQAAKSRDDEKFFKSLQEQAGRRPLSVKQVAALKNVLKKYSGQIAEYEAKQDELELLPLGDDPKNEKLGEVLSLADEVKEWKEPR